MTTRYLHTDTPPAALDDYAEYRRCGGRFPLEQWWERYKDNYTRNAK